MAKSKLVVFLSYATEDQKLADIIAGKLNNAFGRAVDLKYMSQFQLGIDFRKGIDQALDEADILLVVATGREKLSHTYTGYEVGYFRRSQVTRPHIDDNSQIERLIIPIAIFADVPVTLSDIEGIGIGQSDQFFFELIDGKLTGRKDDPLYQLLRRFDRILETLDPSERTAAQQANDDSKYREQAQHFYNEITDLMSTLPLRQEKPKTKIIVRLPPNHICVEHDFSEDVLFSPSGPTSAIFERTPPQVSLPWKDFGKFIGSDELALTWKDALLNLINACVSGDFSQSDQIVFAHDRRRAFRLFISSSTIFFDRSQSLDVYVIPIMPPTEAGDPKTTFLSKGLEAGLRYRSLFLERNSPFSPVMFLFGGANEFRGTINRLLQELRLLLVRSDDARLADRHNLVQLFGPEEAAAEEVIAMNEVWNRQKAALYQAAEKTLAIPEPSLADRRAFIKTLQEFCDSTRPINTSWLKRVMTSLEAELQEDHVAAGEPRRRAEPALASPAPV